MLQKTYGTIQYIKPKDKFELSNVAPHVSIKLKSIFEKIKITHVPPYYFSNLPDVCNDLLWFMQRYPFQINVNTKNILKRGLENYNRNINEIESILLPGYIPGEITLTLGEKARNYQLTGNEFYLKMRRLLNVDDIGLGKTLTAILSFFDQKTRPGLVVVQNHLLSQWQKEGIERFTNLSSHIINSKQPYNLPPADVYIIKYSFLSGWTDLFTECFFRSAIFDEAQELRRTESLKYEAAQVLSNHVVYCQGLTATPVYNYGDEMFNILNLINPDCLGRRDDFLREWCTSLGNGKFKVKDPDALGSYLRDSNLYLRRTREEVGQELPAINKIIHTVDYDYAEVKKHENLAFQLALKITEGSFTERGQASRMLDMLARQVTGVSKARYVAEYVRFLLESELSVLLTGWHREVYDIWLEELADFNPVMYTGSESPKQKDAAKEAFINGDTRLFIISNRSGIGLDGLQKVCYNVVIGELDWSPKVLDQVIGRVDRPGNPDAVNAHYLISDYGSDPPIVSLLGLKSSQSHGIINPFQSVSQQQTDESRIKLLAEQYLKAHAEKYNR